MGKRHTKKVIMVLIKTILEGTIHPQETQIVHYFSYSIKSYPSSTYETVLTTAMGYGNELNFYDIIIIHE